MKKLFFLIFFTALYTATLDSSANENTVESLVGKKLICGKLINNSFVYKGNFDGPAGFEFISDNRAIWYTISDINNPGVRKNKVKYKSFLEKIIIYSGGGLEYHINRFDLVRTANELPGTQKQCYLTDIKVQKILNEVQEHLINELKKNRKF